MLMLCEVTFQRNVSLQTSSHGSLSSGPSRDLWNMTPDPQGYAGRSKAGSLGPRLLGHCSHGNLAITFPPTRSVPALACYLLAHLSPDPSPLLFTVSPCGPSPFPSCSYIASTGLHLPAHAGSSLVDFLYPEDGSDTFLRNVD
jgi:hypothetical protein